MKRLIAEQEKTAAAHAQELRLRLREEVTQLRRRDAELERLLGADDHIHLIQVVFDFLKMFLFFLFIFIYLFIYLFFALV